MAAVMGLALALSLLLSAAPAVLALERCAPISTGEVEGLFERWNAALASGDPDQVSALYSPDALLLPTLSPRPRTDPAGVRDYFSGFLAGGPQGRIDSRTIQLGCNEALDAGTYSFRFRDGHQVQARYTFVYGFGPDGWQIVHHHSSLEPSA